MMPVGDMRFPNIENKKRMLNLHKGFKIVLHVAVVIGQMGIPRAINSGRKGHNLSPLRTHAAITLLIQAGDEKIFRIPSAKGRRIKPASVTMALIRPWGVTLKAGFQTETPSGAVRTPP
jgi:hypothetical protein